MAGLLDRKTIVVRERVRMLKAANAYDLLDPATGQPVGFVEEQVSGFWRKLLRFTSWKTRLSFRITFHDLSAGGAVVLTVSRPFTWFRSVVTVSDATGKPVGTFRQKLLAIGPKMWVLGPGGAHQLDVALGDDLDPAAVAAPDPHRLALQGFRRIAAVTEIAHSTKDLLGLWPPDNKLSGPPEV